MGKWLRKRVSTQCSIYLWRHQRHSHIPAHHGNIFGIAYLAHGVVVQITSRVGRAKCAGLPLPRGGCLMPILAKSSQTVASRQHRDGRPTPSAQHHD